jgi:hypothetical protein
MNRKKAVSCTTTQGGGDMKVITWFIKPPFLATLLSGYRTAKLVGPHLQNIGTKSLKRMIIMMADF